MAKGRPLMKVAHFGTFDVDNYGDLLFPYVAEWRLPKVEWVHVAPIGGKAQFIDALNSLGFSEFQGETIGGVVIGGGNIVHLRRSSVAKYQSIASFAYPSLVAGAAQIASAYGVPLMFNGPSVAGLRLGYFERRILQQVFSRAIYLGFRDRVSVETVSALGLNGAKVIPDTAFDISRMWPVGVSAGNPNRGGYFVVHVNNRYGGGVDATAKAIDNMAKRMGVQAVFLPIGPCHGDVEYMRVVAARMRSAPRLVEQLSLRQFAMDIAHARLYVGSSMHGFITALSYGVPCLLILGEKIMGKFVGLLDVAELPEYAIQKSWSEAAERTHLAVTLSDKVRSSVLSLLDLHWGEVWAALNSPAPRMNTNRLANWRREIWLSRAENIVRKVFALLQSQSVSRMSKVIS